MRSEAIIGLLQKGCSWLRRVSQVPLSYAPQTWTASLWLLFFMTVLLLSC